MGMVDTISCELELPGLEPGKRYSFQTKDLFCYGANLAITKGGRLVEYLRYRDPASGRDLDYHGDIRFCGDCVGGPLHYFVARFTHGQLEWIRAASELPEPYMRMLEARSH